MVVCNIQLITAIARQLIGSIHNIIQSSSGKYFQRNEIFEAVYKRVCYGKTLISSDYNTSNYLALNGFFNKFKAT